MFSSLIRGLGAAKSAVFRAQHVNSPPGGFAAASLLQLQQCCGLHLSPTCMAEPLKRKKRMDPAILRAREDRKKRKLEKAIRRLEKHAKQLKPVDECQISLKLKQEIPMRTRHAAPPSAEILESRAEAFKQWTKHRSIQALKDQLVVEKMMAAQDHALAELRAESEELYQAAIQIDPELIPYTAKGCVETLPPENYDPPDGEYRDVSKKWV